MTGTVKAEAAQRRVKEYQDKGVERAMKRTKLSPEETQMDTSTTSSSSSGGAAPASRSSGSGDAARTISATEDNGSSKVGNNRKADGEQSRRS